MSTIASRISSVLGFGRTVSPRAIPEFKPVSKRDLSQISNCIAPRELIEADRNNPNIKYYFFPISHISALYPNVEEVFKKTVRLAGAGTGILISNEGHILTNAHVASSLRDPSYCGPVHSYENLNEHLSCCLGSDYWFKLGNARLLYAGKSTYRNPDSSSKPTFEYIYDPDLAIIHVPALAGHGYVPIRETSCKAVLENKSDPIFLIGNPCELVDKQQVSIGNINGFITYAYPTTGLIIASEALIKKGMSGGPLIDENGNLLGVNFLVSDDFKTAYAIPIWKGSDAYKLAGLEGYFK